MMAWPNLSNTSNLGTQN